MTVIILMAAELNRQLLKRGVAALSACECEEIVTRLLALPAEIANGRKLTRAEADEISRRST